MSAPMTVASSQAVWLCWRADGSLSPTPPPPRVLSPDLCLGPGFDFPREKLSSGEKVTSVCRYGAGSAIVREAGEKDG